MSLSVSSGMPLGLTDFTEMSFMSFMLWHEDLWVLFLPLIKAAGKVGHSELVGGRPGRSLGP